MRRILRCGIFEYDDVTVFIYAMAVKDKDILFTRYIVLDFDVDRELDASGQRRKSLSKVEQIERGVIAWNVAGSQWRLRYWRRTRRAFHVPKCIGCRASASTYQPSGSTCNAPQCRQLARQMLGALPSSTEVDAIHVDQALLRSATF